MARVCIASTRWRDTNVQYVPSLLSVLEASGYRLKFSSICPDFIFNNSGASIAFIVVLCWEQLEAPGAWDRVVKMNSNFRHSYLMTTVSEDTRFIDSYFSFNHQLKKLFLVPVRNWSTTQHIMLGLVDVHAEIKNQGCVSSEIVEQLEFVTSSDAVVHSICAIPGLELHDAHSLLYGFGSLREISHASEESIKERTDLSSDKATAVMQFFRNDSYNRTPVLE